MPSTDRTEVDKILDAYSKLPAATRRALAPVMLNMASKDPLRNVDENSGSATGLAGLELSALRKNLNVGPAVVGLLFLALSLLSAIVNLPSFLMLAEQSIYLKVIWRYAALLAVLVSPIITDFMEDAPRLAHLLYSNIFPVLFLSLLHASNVYLVYFAVSHTFVVHTLLLCSIPTTFLAAWRIARRLPFTRLEYLGIGFNVFGAYLCCCESPADAITSTSTLTRCNRKRHARWKLLRHRGCDYHCSVFRVQRERTKRRGQLSGAHLLRHDVLLHHRDQLPRLPMDAQPREYSVGGPG